VTAVTGGPWPGCHGVRVRASTELGIGHTRGEPLAEVEVVIGTVPDQLGEQVWSVAGPATTSDEALDQRLYRHPGGRLSLRIGEQGRLSIAVDDHRIVARAPFDAIQAQLLVSFAFPLLLEPLPVVVFHAAAVARDGEAILVMGPGGTGKSSSLVGLVNAGWTAISEDVCVVDLGGPEAPLVWPGPPWVRRRHHEPGPIGASQKFTTSEKTAWDLTPWQAGTPVPVAGAVIMEAPGGDAPLWTSADRAAAIGLLAAHAVWLGDQESRGRHLFGRVVATAGRIPVATLRLPRAAAWIDQLVEAVEKRAASLR
jgi:hypothetical protein